MFLMYPDWLSLKMNSLMPNLTRFVVVFRFYDKYHFHNKKETRRHICLIHKNKII